MRGKHKTRPHKLKETIRESVRTHIKLFPLVPSHYTRKNSAKMYLEEGLSIQKMYRLYTEYCSQNNIMELATSRQYRDILNNEFNMVCLNQKRINVKFAQFLTCQQSKKRKTFVKNTSVI
ncbi:hypothetical protein PPYR_02340 [Photinus pyralis]|uniref:Uncharacterized protein n=1 Tax=Photinus pyralis TaxID=7054 RepID=A0A5N4B7N9_PHOPY|nr:hypothetical protein PPYR_02340 [Photinus pyralis]